MSLLHVDNLSIRLTGQPPLIQQVSFTVAPGETLAIVGESGSGKSLSMLAVLGLLPAAMRVTGKLHFQDSDLGRASREQLRRLRGAQIGYISQDPLSNLHPLKSVGRQIEEAIQAHRPLPRRALRQRVMALLEEVGIADAARRYHDRPAKFSGGMRQRVMIAMAIALNPALIIADEPTTALDVTVQASILRLLKRLQQQHGCALIFISHDLRVVADIADRVIVMRQGKIVEQGSREALFNAPQHPYTRELFDAGWPRFTRNPVAAQDERPLLRVVDLGRQFSRSVPFWQKSSAHPVLEAINFTLHRGEILGLVGESGSGKTTLGRIIVGLDTPDRGEITFDGRNWQRAGQCSPTAAHPQRHAIQMVFQDPYSSLNPRRRIGDILAEPVQIVAQRERGGVLSPQALLAAVADLLATVELPGAIASRYPGQLSGGQRQRVVIARALAINPRLIVADEAVSALDVTTQYRILQLLLRLRQERDLSILFISHDLAAVAALCDRVLVMQAGHIIEQGRTAEVFQRPQQAWTRQLIQSIPGQQRPTLTEAI